MWLLLGLVLLLSILLIRKQPQQEPLTAGEVDIAKVEEGEEFARLYGTSWINDAQVAWWGDVSATEIRSSSGGKK